MKEWNVKIEDRKDNQMEYLCERCKNRPIPKGLKQIKCLVCGKDSVKIYDAVEICSDCLIKENKCDVCGQKLIN